MRSIGFEGVLFALVLATGAGCAQVQDPPGLIPDTQVDVAPDTSLDTAGDAPVDLPVDSTVDTEPDVPVDTELDTAYDTGVDTAYDTGVDTVYDTGIDTVYDTGIDTVYDTGIDTVTDTGTDPGTGWGVPVCGFGYTMADTGAYTDSVVIPALGTMRVMQLDIVIEDRRYFGFEIPFDDLVVSITSPGGTEHVFWNEFESDDTGGFSPNYAFPSTWLLPRWWNTSVGGTWTLDVDDTALSGLPAVPTTITSWCLTPIDPAVHATTAYDSTLYACASATGSIDDCDSSGSPYGYTNFEMQVDDLILASGTPVLELGMSHSSPSDLTITFTTANGYVHTLWSGSGGSIPSSFNLTGLTGQWMTGRYQLHVVDDTYPGTGSVSSWCVRAN